MTWRPGQPVVTTQDVAEWEAWRSERKRQQQRDRRACNPRIDYYPSPEALEAITGSRSPGIDLSRAINRIVLEWAGGLPPE